MEKGVERHRRWEREGREIKRGNRWKGREGG